MSNDLLLVIVGLICAIAGGALGRSPSAWLLAGAAVCAILLAT